VWSAAIAIALIAASRMVAWTAVLPGAVSARPRIAARQKTRVVSASLPMPRVDLLRECR
jgi:hypothetical protein